MPAAERATPCLGCHFQVSASPLKNGACSMVVLPVFQAAASAEKAPLLLQRGFTGALDFHAWWQGAQGSQKKPRGTVVTVTVLAAPGGPAVARWRFAGCVPVSLSYTPLDALSSNVLTETLALSWASFSLLPAG